MKIEIFLFILGFILSYLFTGEKGKEGKYFPNLVIVKDTSSCNNVCYHIHHWMFLSALLILYFVLNFILGYQKIINLDEYFYLISLVLGASISEYIQFGDDIFIITTKCFNGCK